MKREEYEKRLKEKEEDLSPEEQLKRQKESDLNLALETTFGDTENAGNLDLNNLESKEEFIEYSDMILKHVQLHSKKIEYPNFVENLVRNLCATRKLNDFNLLTN